MKVFTKYKLELIKEESHKYEVDTKISKPQDLVDVLNLVCRINNNTEEVMLLLTLNTKNVITGWFEVSRGSINESIVHPREIFKRALTNNATSIVVAHNHPSGDPNPSKEDINITNRLKECGKLLGINLIDHIIIGDEKYVSLKEKGII